MFNIRKCTICGSTSMILNFEIFRESFQCAECYSQPRVRYLKYILDNDFSDYTEKKLHESSPVKKSFLKKFSNNYSYSYYNPDMPFGLDDNGVFNVNIENLSCFSNETFDYFITQDVMEHVYNPENAFREIHRVLKKGGSHIFTVPTYTNLKSNPRIKLINNIVVHIQDPQYHKGSDGSPSLVTMDYGVDMNELIEKWVGSPLTVFSYNFLEYKPLQVFAITK